MPIGPKAFPMLLMALNVGAAIRYACDQNWWMTGYWIAAFCLTGIVTFKP